MLGFTSKKLSLSDISEIENQLGIQFPDEIKTFYLKYNGGISEKDSFYIERECGYTRVQMFLPFKYPTEQLGEMLIEESYINLQRKNIITPNYLPFAVDAGGNYFSVDMNNGDIVLILTDLGELSADSVKFLINGFDEFIENLEEEEEEDV